MCEAEKEKLKLKPQTVGIPPQVCGFSAFRMKPLPAWLRQAAVVVCACYLTNTVLRVVEVPSVKTVRSITIVPFSGLSSLMPATL